MSWGLWYLKRAQNMEKKKKQQYQLISLTNVFTCYIERVNSLKSDCKANRGLMMMMNKKLCHIHISRETLLLWECAIVGSRLFGVARNYTLAAIFLYTHTEQQMAKQTNLLFFPIRFAAPFRTFGLNWFDELVQCFIYGFMSALNTNPIAKHNIAQHRIFQRCH